MKFIFIASCLLLSACTLTNVMTKGQADDVVDTSPQTEAKADVSVPVSAVPSVPAV